jgi:hypothetical protein
MALEDEINLLINTQEGSATTPTLLLRLILVDKFSSWWGRRHRLERLAVADGILEVPVVLLGVAHLLMVRTLGVEDLIHCSFIATRRAVGLSRWRSSGVHFFTGPFVPTLVLLLVHILLWCRGCGLCVADEVLGSFVDSDVDVRLTK